MRVTDSCSATYIFVGILNAGGTMSPLNINKRADFS